MKTLVSQVRVLEMLIVPIVNKKIEHQLKFMAGIPDGVVRQEDIKSVPPSMRFWNKIFIKSTTPVNSTMTVSLINNWHSQQVSKKKVPMESFAVEQ